jgi:hypothetical protein
VRREWVRVSKTQNIRVFCCCRFGCVKGSFLMEWGREI